MLWSLLLSLTLVRPIVMLPFLRTHQACSSGVKLFLTFGLVTLTCLPLYIILEVTFMTALSKSGPLSISLCYYTLLLILYPLSQSIIIIITTHFLKLCLIRM